MDQVDGQTYYTYDPKYFDVDSIMVDFAWNERNVSLMKAQNTVAIMAGFRKWTDVHKASEAELELAKLLFDNQEKMNAEDWSIYIAIAERDNQMPFDADARLDIYKHVVLRAEGPRSAFPDYRLNRRSSRGPLSG